MSKKVLKITQGALMTAIFGVLVFLNRQTAGFAEQILVYVYPLPIAIYCARYGFKDGVPALIAMMLLAFFLGSLTYAFYASTSLLIGYVCGGCIAHGMSAKKTLLFMMVIGVIVNLVDILVMSKISGISFMDQVTELKDMSTEMMNSMTGFLPQSSNAQSRELLDSLNSTYETLFSVEFLKKFLIVATIITGVLQAFLIFMLSTIIMRRMKIKVPKFELKGKLVIPAWIGYIVGVLTLASYFFIRYRLTMSAAAGEATDLASLDTLENAALAIYMVGHWFFVIFGIAPTSRLLYTLFRSRPASVILTVIGVFMLSSAVSLIGFFDIIKFLEKILPAKTGAKTGDGSSSDKNGDGSSSGGDKPRGSGVGEHTLTAASPIALADPDKVDYLMLVNPWRGLPEGYDAAVEPKLETYHSPYTDRDIRLEKRTMQAALDMKAAMEEDGLLIDFCDGFRSVKKQEEVMEKMIAQYGEEYARSFVAVPGHSEHNTGLALDVYLVIDGKACRDRAVYLHEDERWAKVHEYLTTYGFILRYPEGKRDVTGIIYEPWHFRFVGEGAAARIAMEGVTLEEYLERHPGGK